MASTLGQQFFLKAWNYLVALETMTSRNILNFIIYTVSSQMPRITNCPGPVGITSYASASIGAVPGSESRCKASDTSPEALERETKVKQRPFGR